MRVPGYFGTTPQEINEAHNTNLDTVVSDLATQVDNWNSRGSGFIIDHLMKFVICVTKFRPLHGSSFIPTPKRIGNKHCTLNIKSNDEKCFLWSVLACLHPVSQNPERVSKYLQYEHTLNIEGLSFPLPIKDIPKFEKLNPSISINVLSLDDKDFCIEYCSPEHQRPNHVNQLLLDEEGSDKRHYILIKNMSSLVAHRTHHNGQTYVMDVSILSQLKRYWIAISQTVYVTLHRW